MVPAVLRVEWILVEKRLVVGVVGLIRLVLGHPFCLYPHNT
jgi:hypothetical protein